MKKIGLQLAFPVLMLVMLLWPAGAALADGPVVQQDGGEVYFDEDVTLEPGEVVNGSLGLINGDLTMPADSTVRGDVFVTNGDADIAGRVEGNVAVVSGDLTLAPGSEVRGDVLGTGGNSDLAGIVMGNVSTMFGHLQLRSTAVLHGDLTVVSGTMDREAGAQVLGESMPNLRLPELERIRPELERILPELERILPELSELPEGERILPPVPTVPAVPEAPWVPARPQRDGLWSQVGRFLGRTVSAGTMTLLGVAVGLLLVLIWPRPVRRVAECITIMPWQCFGLGLLTFLLAAGLEALAAVLMILIFLVAALLMATVVLIPVGILLILLAFLVLLPVPVALAGAMLLGWVSVADVVGQRVLRVLKAREAKTLGSVLLGMLLTGALVAMLWILEPVCCGGLVAVLLTSVGVGAVFHTRFGRQGCQPGRAGTAVAVAGGPLPAEAMDDEVGRPDVPPAP